MKCDKILIVTTIPATLTSVLSGQPRSLNEVFEVGCVSSPGEHLELVAQDEGVPVWSVPMHRGISPFRDLIAIFRFWLLLRRLRPDIVHSYTPKAGLVAMVSSLLSGVPCRIHTFTGLIFPTSSGIKRKLLIWIDKLICVCATKVVPEGKGVKKDLQNYKITRKPLALIGSGNIAGVDTKHFAPGDYYSRSVPEVPGFVFCFVGRLNKDKGVDELVSAFLKLPGDCSLFLIGRIDEVSPVARETLALIRESSNIYMVGNQDDVRPFMARADVLVLPSYREGFPNVILEAGAMSMPVIATDISGCNELIVPAWNGWLVPPRSVYHLEQAMLEAKNCNPAAIKLMGQNARQKVVASFERKSYQNTLVGFYDRCLLERSNRSL